MNRFINSIKEVPIEIVILFLLVISAKVLIVFEIPVEIITLSLGLLVNHIQNNKGTTN